MKFIATCQEASIELAKHELTAFCANNIVQLTPSLLLCDTSLELHEISGKCASGEMIFVRHLCPVDAQAETPTPERSFWSDVLLPMLQGMALPVAAQIRSAGGGDSDTRRALYETISEVCKASGVEIQRPDPRTVVSVVLTKNATLVGVCDAKLALSSWPGGEVRYRHDDARMVSRAELKLVEAMDVLRFAPFSELPVLDLGAAPGGWTRILAESGYQVVAVDPAELDPSVLRLRGVVHHRAMTQEFLSGQVREKFGAIVNDMRMDPLDSAQSMLDCLPRLTANAVALMTIKLEKTSVIKTFETLKETLRLLESGFDIVAVRQLFHNRSECTAVLRRKDIAASIRGAA